MAEDVYRELRRHRRREVQLSALFQTANDLAALRDPDKVLQAIVDRARMLLEADVSYLTLHDPQRGDTYMRITSGSVSATFQQVRLPMGAGLGGLVAQTAMPYNTADYAADSRFWHTASIDNAVTDEGLVGILGCPLRLGGTVIGVLFAADRTQRPFGTEEVSLLGSLADHAAIAIDNANRLQQTRTALTELDATTTLLRERTVALERAAEAHDRLTDLVLRGTSLADLANAVTELLGGTLVVLSTSGKRVCGEELPAGSDPATDASAIEIARTHSRASHSGGRWIARIAAGSEQLGALVLHRDPGLDHGEQRILERAAMATAVLLLLRRSVAEAEHRVRGDLLVDLISAPHRDQDRLLARADALGIDLGGPHLVAVLDAGDDEPQRAGRRLARFAARHAGLASQHRGRSVLLLPGKEAGAVARTVAAELGVTVGAAGPNTGLPGVPGTHAAASRCLDALLALGRCGEGACLADLGFLGLVLGNQNDIPGFVRGVLGPVLDYDRRRGTELVATLEAYFAADRSPAHAHESLHVHVNTVTQRLERITTLLGADWQRPDRALEVQLALKLHRAGAVEQVL